MFAIYLYVIVQSKSGRSAVIKYGGNMKKLIFLLLMAVAVVGLLSAATGAAHPPGVPAAEMVLSGYSVYDAAVTPDTVLAAQPIIIALPDLYASQRLFFRPERLEFSLVETVETPGLCFVIEAVNLGKFILLKCLGPFE